MPSAPIIFTKATTAVIGPRDAVDSKLDPTGTVDYECELGVVIGRGGRGIRAADALAHVFGYVIINDVTSRELQKRPQPMGHRQRHRYLLSDGAVARHRRRGG